MFQGGSSVGYGVYIAAGTDVHDVKIEGCTFFGHDYHGIMVSGGTKIDIRDNSIMQSSMHTSNTFSEIYFANGTSYFNITNNSCGYQYNSTSASPAAYGISIIGTSHDYYMVIGNNCYGNQSSTTGYVDQGTGTHKHVVANYPIP